MNTLRIATRKSPLALWQAEHIANTLVSHWPSLQIELVPMVTSGDRFLKDKLLSVGGKGLFVKELEEALLKKHADIAVHSMKDVPAAMPTGLILPIICKRASPFDAFISPSYTNLKTLPLGATVGTSSLRRQSQLLAIRPDLHILSLRGNINTRLAKLMASEFDAIILAVAGLERMGMHVLIKEILSEEIMLPSCGQGALGIECRANDSDILKLLAPLNDLATTQCVQTERAVNALLGGSCHVPLAVYCKTTPDSHLILRAKVASTDGRMVIEDSQQGHENDWQQLADRCAQALKAKGAEPLLGLL